MRTNPSGRIHYVGLLQALTDVLGSARGYLADHGPRVALLSAKLGDRLGLEPRDTAGLFFASLLSDVGMVGLAEDAWENPVPELPEAVRQRVRRHPIRSEARVGLIPHLEDLAPLVRHHHEWWDGSGYPDGLTGRAIPLGAQILRLSDTVVALGRPRPHREALAADDVFDTVIQSVGREFAPEVARTYLALHRAGYLPKFEHPAFRLALIRASRDLLPERVSPLSGSHLLDILANLIDAKDPHTAGHSRRVAMLATAVGAELGLGDHMRSALWAGGYLHDLGKLRVPLRVLLKEEALTPTEERLARAHATDGAEILERIPTLRHLAPGTRHHHERWDGSGYPDGLRGDDIPLVAQILGICDAYDSMTSTRAFRGSRTHRGALRELRRCSGSHFGPRVAEALLALPDHVFAAVHAESQAVRRARAMELPLFPSPSAERLPPLPQAG